MFMAFTKNPLQDGTKTKLSDYSNDLENRIGNEFENVGLHSPVKNDFRAVTRFNNGFYIETYRISDTSVAGSVNHVHELHSSLAHIPTVLVQIGGYAQEESKHYKAYVRRGGSAPTTTRSQVAIIYENNAGYVRPMEIYVTVIGFWK